MRIVSPVPFVLVAVVAGMFAGAFVFADHIVVLKGGGVILAKEPYTIEGRRAVLRSVDGQLISVALADIDLDRTREANASDVVVVPRADLSPTSPPPGESKTAETAKGRVIDNFSLRAVKGGNLNIRSGEGGEEDEEGGEERTAPPSLEEIRAKEQELNKMVEAINAKVKESVERGIGNLPAQKRLEEEVNQMRATYEQEWKNYTASVERYNASLPGALPPRSESGGDATTAEGGEVDGETPRSQDDGMEPSRQAGEDGGDESPVSEPGEPIGSADPDSW